MGKSISLLTMFVVCGIMQLSAQVVKDTGIIQKEIIPEVKVTAPKAVEVKGDRTVFDVSNQTSLNNGSLLEVIKKLPGLIVSDVGGMLYQGQPLSVYIDKRPIQVSGISFNSFLDGIPAGVVDHIEVITSPGAEFQATSGGAILNIVTNSKAQDYLSANLTTSYRFSDYDKWRSKENTSLLLNGKNKILSWQLNAGQGYNEQRNYFNLDNLTTSTNDVVPRRYFVNSGINFDIGRDKLLLNYNLAHADNDVYIQSDGSVAGVPYKGAAKTENNTLWQEAVATYQKRFRNAAQKLDFKFAYTRYTTDFSQVSNGTVKVLNNSSLHNNYNFRTDYTTPLKLMGDSKLNVGGMYEKLDYSTISKFIQNLNYNRQTIGAYAEINTKIKKFDITAGVRGEDYNISGTALNAAAADTNLLPYKKFRLFPNARVQYNFNKIMNLAVNYNQKIGLPAINSLNPNNQLNQSPNFRTGGNPYLQPSFFNNYEAKLSFFTYAYIGYSISDAQNNISQTLIRNKDVITFIPVNFANLTIHSFNVGIPIPLKIFTQGFKKAMTFDYNPDQANFIFIAAGSQRFISDKLPDSKTSWNFNITGQLLLPAALKLTAQYSEVTPGGFYLFQIQQPLNQHFDLTLSRKFIKDQLVVSVFANDIFNTDRNAYLSVAQLPYVSSYQKKDTRSFGISLSYKFKQAHKLAKEGPSILNKSTLKEDPTILK
jgi:hypothetical protein